MSTLRSRLTKLEAQQPAPSPARPWVSDDEWSQVVEQLAGEMDELEAAGVTVNDPQLTPHARSILVLAQAIAEIS